MKTILIALAVAAGIYITAPMITWYFDHFVLANVLALWAMLAYKGLRHPTRMGLGRAILFANIVGGRRRRHYRRWY
jgi:hypothetical protein